MILAPVDLPRSRVSHVSVTKMRNSPAGKRRRDSAAVQTYQQGDVAGKVWLSPNAILIRPSRAIAARLGPRSI